MKDRFKKPKIRSFSEEAELKKKPRYEEYLVKQENPKDKEMTEGLSEKFKEAVFMKRKKEEDVPYVLGYSGFRPGVTAKGFFGKNFRIESLKSIDQFNKTQHC